MKILLSSAAYSLTDSFPASEGMFAYQLIRRLQGYNCFFYAVATNIMIRKSLENAKLHEVKIPNDHVLQRNSVIQKLSGAYYALRNYSISIEILNKEKIDIVHHMFPSVAWVSFSLLPVLSNIIKRNPFTFGPITVSEGINGPLSKMVSNLHLKTIKKCDAIIVTTHKAREVYSRIIDLDKIYVIPLATDTEFFTPKIRKENDFNDILVVCNLSKRKGLKYLINAMSLVLKKNKHVRLRIIGEGPERNSLIQLAKQMKLQSNISFEGRVTRIRLRNAYQEADVFCLPSLNEGFPFSVREAMATGKPVVATNVGEVPKIVDHMKTGVLLPPANSEALAEALLMLINDKKMSRKMGERSRRKAVENYSWERIIQEYYRVYETLLYNR